MDGSLSNALRDEITANRFRSPLGQLQIVFIASDAVGVAFDGDLEAGIRLQDAGHARELLARAWLEIRAGGVEEHVGHVHDQAASRFARLEDDVELLLQLVTELGALTFRLRRGLCRLLGASLGIRPLSRQLLRPTLGVCTFQRQPLSRGFSLCPRAVRGPSFGLERSAFCRGSRGGFIGGSLGVPQSLLCGAAFGVGALPFVLRLSALTFLFVGAA